MVHGRKSAGAMSGSRLSIEIGSSLQIQFEKIEERLRGTFVGMESHAFLILRVPASPEIENELYEGNEVILRYVCLGNVYGFRSKILYYTIDPFRLVFLAYPEKVEILNLRKKPRVDCYIPATSFLAERKLKGVIMDISSSGCRLTLHPSATAPQPDIRPGDVLKLSFPFLGIKGDLDFAGKARNITEEKGKLSIGIQFDELDKEIADEIDVYVKRVLEFTGT